MPQERDEKLFEEQRRMSPWIPVALITFTTAALAVPLVALRSRRHALKNGSLSATAAVSLAPPRRRSGRPIPVPPPSPSLRSTEIPGANIPPPRGIPRSPSRLSANPVALSGASPIAKPLVPRSAHQTPALSALSAPLGPPEDNFNAAWHGFKAFGTATAAVTLVAFGGLWGIKSYLGVQDTREFIARMRILLGGALPALATRMNRAVNSAPLPPAFSMPVSLPPPPEEDTDTSTLSAITEEEIRAWTWEGAKSRLAEAYAEGGVARWAEIALREIELEATQLRTQHYTGSEDHDHR